MPLLKAAAKPLGLLDLTAASSLTDALIHKKVGSGANNATLIISNDELNDILKIVKSLEDSGILLKGVSATMKDEAKGQKSGFLSMLLGNLGASLLGDLLTKSYKGVIREGVIREGEGTFR